ncbi:phosphatidylserine decarboxylase-domain-containing protein [Trametes elegans]|nr:phosphatidylserine decarboxylase-domain-containing protein [Trametes elegans]
MLVEQQQHSLLSDPWALPRNNKTHFSLPVQLLPATTMSSPNIVQKLRSYLDENPDFKAEFAQSLERAKGYNISEFTDWGIDTLDDYLNYYEKYLHWVPTKTEDGAFVYHHICVFYFVLGQFPVAARQSPIEPSTRSPYTWLSQWLIDYAQEMGRWMDSPESISAEAVDTFYNAKAYHMEDYDRVDWRTFNDFFARKIRAEARPIDRPGDDDVIVSPADSTFDGWWPVDDGAACRFDAKGIPWAIGQLLDDEACGTDVGPAFAGGTFCHAFLGPNDYHRQHAPVAGTVVEARFIPGLCYLEVEVVAGDPKRGGRPRLGMRRRLRDRGGGGAPENSLDAPDGEGYQFLQARALILIDNPALGLVAVLPIGMAQVSSVRLSVKVGDKVEKGDEISYFQFGGSDIVMVFQAQADVKFTAEKETHYNFGNTVALASPAGCK